MLDPTVAAAAATALAEGAARRGKQAATVSWSCQLVTQLALTAGTFEVNNTWLTFTPATDDEGAASQIIGRYGMDLDGRAYDAPKHWPVVKLQQIHGRRYLLRNSALEFVFIDRATLFIDFGSALLRREAYR